MKDARFNIYRRVSLFSGIIAITIGTLAIVGWIVRAPVLTSLNHDWVSMKVNTAIGFILAGTAILCLVQANKADLKSSFYSYSTKIFSLALFLLGALTALEYVQGIDLHIDQLFFRQKPGVLDLSAPGRMSPFTAIMQMNYAIALLLLDDRKKRDTLLTIAQGCAFAGGVVGILALIGYLLNAKELYAVGQTTAIAVLTALGFIVVTMGLLFLQPRRAFMRTFTSQTKTGEILRRVVPLGLILPILAGWLRLKGQQCGLYGFETGLAIMVTFCVVSCEAAVFWIARKYQATESALSQREELLRQQAELLNLTSDAIMVRQLEGNIIFWNKGAEVMYGYSADEATSKTSHALLKTKFPVELAKIQSMVLEEGRWEGEVVHYTKNNEPIIVASRWSLKKDNDGKAVAILEINNDIRAAKNAEQRVNDFYSTVSHELRTPLTSIRGSFSLLAGGRAGALSERGQNLVTVGLKETERLIRLINDILDIKKLEAGKLELHIENIEPKLLVEQTITAAGGFAMQHQVALVFEIIDNDFIRGDKDRLIQILTNLISNAIKFSDPGQTVTIVTNRKDGDIRFSVLDRGPGIDPQNVPKLFRMFEQVGTADASRGGTGLGLAICKQLVEQHDGTIGIETQLGKGSTFWFEIPRAHGLQII